MTAPANSKTADKMAEKMAKKTAKKMKDVASVPIHHDIYTF